MKYSLLSVRKCTALFFLVSSLVIALASAGYSQGFFGQALQLYNQNKLDSAAVKFEQVVTSQPDNVDARAYLAETYRRLGQTDEALKFAREVLAVDSCNALAHLVIAEALRGRYYDPRSDSDSNWVHLSAALRCDSTDGNVWLALWNDAILREKNDVMDQALRKLRETGFLTDAALSFGRWLLESLPPDAILVTNGDMDTYPLLTLQETENLRPDVVVAEYGLLGTQQDQRYLSKRYALPLPLDNASLDSLVKTDDAKKSPYWLAGKIFNGWVRMKNDGRLERPLALSVTFDRSLYKDISDQFVYAGSYMLWTERPEAVDSLNYALNSLARVEADDFAGPWASGQDRSPVRRVYNKYLIRNVTWTMLSCAEMLIDVGRIDEARQQLDRAEKLESASELGATFTERIAELRKKAGGE